MSASSPTHRPSPMPQAPEPADEAWLSPEALIEDLRIHQAELELQAQALDASQRAAEQLARRYRHLFSETPIGICRINDRGQIVEANQAAARLLQSLPEQLAGQLLYRFGADDAARRLLLEGLHKAVRQPQHTLKGLWISRHGEPVLTDLHFSLSPETGSSGLEVTVVLIDQTQSHREHQSLRQAVDELRLAHELNQELALVADRSPVGTLICDAQMRIRWANPAFVRQSGYSLVEARHQHPELLLGAPGQGTTAMQALLATLALEGSVDRQVVQRRRKDGRLYQAELSIVPHLDDQQRVTRYIVLEQDITDRLKAEADHEALLLAQARHAAKTEFLSRMSHNMRTPLNAVLGFSQLLINGQEPALHEQHRARLQLIHDAGQQLLTLVDQALQLIRVDHEADRVKTRAFEVGPLLREGLLMLQDKAQARGIQLRLEGSSDAVVMADEQPVREILLNLLTNAIKYSPAQALVTIRLDPDPGTGLARIQVSDQGCGIAEDDQEAIFQPFVRLDATRDMAPGHGIGLAISRQLAQALGGQITVRSTVGQGSTFELTLPLADAPPQKATLPRTGSGDDLIGRLARLPALDVLYVEDNAMNRALMQAALEDAPRVRLRLADTLAEARQVIAEQTPDVVLLDMNLPDGHGLDLLPRLRQAAVQDRPIHVVAVSADALPEHIEEATRAGVDGYLVKPLHIGQLCDVLSQAANEPSLSFSP